MLIGAQVKSSGGLLKALERGEAMGADAIQVFTQSPRMWRPPAHDIEALAAYRRAAAAHPSIKQTFCHATYLVNLATPDHALAEKSLACLVDNLVVASAIGARGLVLHVGSHRGAGLDGALETIAKALHRAFADAEGRLEAGTSPILLENTAGAGGTIGRSFDELARIIDASGGDRRLGVCLDTQHLFASGVGYDSIAAADAALEALDRAVGLERLGCVHLNESKVPLGANRDRHANLGEGEIGDVALGSLLSHPRLQALAAVMEVPGDGDGPRAVDVAAAREILAAGLAAREKAARRQRASPRSAPARAPRRG